jgi:branched-chain amino acid transport system permease protein
MDLIESYSEDLQLIRKTWTKVWVGAIWVAIFLLPLYCPESWLYIATVICIYAIGVQGQNLLIGYTGQISFGQAGFLAIGAYAFGHLSRHGVPLPVSLVSAGLAAGLFGVVVGFPSLRLKGPYLAIVTMGFAIAVYQIFANSEILSGGRMGLHVEKLEPWFGLSETVFNFYFNLIIMVLFTLLSYNIVSSYMGRAFIAIRDNDIAAEVIGVNLTRYKLLSFAISSFYTGIQGGLFALILGHLEPDRFIFWEGLPLFVAVIIGGLASVEGSIMGAAFVILVPHVFSTYFPSYSEFVPTVFGLTIVIVLIFEPLGLAGRYLKTRLYLRNWPFR